MHRRMLKGPVVRVRVGVGVRDTRRKMQHDLPGGMNRLIGQIEKERRIRIVLLHHFNGSRSEERRGVMIDGVKLRYGTIRTTSLSNLEMKIQRGVTTVCEIVLPTAVKAVKRL